MATWEMYTKILFGKESNEVIQFFRNDIPAGTKFASREDYFEGLADILKKYCQVLRKGVFDYGLWYKRKLYLNKLNARRILLCMNVVKSERLERNLGDSDIRAFRKAIREERIPKLVQEAIEMKKQENSEQESKEVEYVIHPI